MMVAKIGLFNDCANASAKYDRFLEESLFWHDTH